MEGFDQVVVERTNRKHALSARFLSWLYSELLGYLTDLPLNHKVGNFGIYSKRVIDEVRQLREPNWTFGLAVLWIGYSRVKISVQHDTRFQGKTTYSFRSLLKRAIAGVTSYSDKPLRVVVYSGMFVSVISSSLGSWTLVTALFGGKKPSGWTSIEVISLFSTGLLLVSIGVVGLYVGRIFESTKSRPNHVIESSSLPTKYR